MKQINTYIIEKLKLNQDSALISPIQERYKVGNICLRIDSNKSDTPGKGYISLIFIDELNWEDRTMYFSSTYSHKDVTFGKSYKYKFKDIKKYDYLYLAKSYGVEDDEIIIPQEESLHVLEEIINNKFKIDFNKFFNDKNDKYIIDVGFKGIKKDDFDLYKRVLISKINTKKGTD